MSDVAGADVTGARIDAAAAERTELSALFFDAHAQRIASLCHRMAERFARGGRLIALGRSPAARSDARHVAVEFVHPVIVGKRALPALAMTPEGGDLRAQVDRLAKADDAVVAFDAADAETAAALGLAGERGCLTVAFAADAGEWTFDPPSDDPFLRQEVVETLYHVLWELVHVFFEHRGLLRGRDVRQVHDAGASSFLYPFLAEQETDLDAVIADVARSVLMKAREVEELRTQTLRDGGATLMRAARGLAGCGKVLAAGNGGSATDAMDVAADLREAGCSALDLTEDAGILTAIANDIGVDAIFARQVIAYGEAGDALLTLSTSGNSANVVAALLEARRREMTTIALVGYDGGRVAHERLADHVIVTRSQHIPRIQEAQASAYHVLTELVGEELLR